jgi:hypothetical protein
MPTCPRATTHLPVPYDQGIYDILFVGNNTQYFIDCRKGGAKFLHIFNRGKNYDIKMEELVSTSISFPAIHKLIKSGV